MEGDWQCGNRPGEESGSRPEDDALSYDDIQFEMIDLGLDFKEHMSSDAFYKKVSKKSSSLLIGRHEAELEVCVDIVTEREGGMDKALLFVVSKLEDESKIIPLINNLISRGANIATKDLEQKTPLHHAVQKGHRAVAAKLLENKAPPHIRDKAGNLPFKMALDQHDDDMCSLLLAYMPNSFVRRIFSCSGMDSAELSFHELLKASNMQKTVITVLDCMVETRGNSDSITVYYNILEADEDGRPPNHQNFNPQQKSPLHRIAKVGVKNYVYHDAVRLLIRRKWKTYARLRFQFNTFLYVLTLACLTFAAIVSVSAEDPRVYNSALHIGRAVTEVISLVLVLATLFTEINQLIRHKLEYFTDLFNYMDAGSAILIICVLPLRYTQNNAQWHVFAFGYLCWIIRIFKFAAIFRQTGAYAQILYRVLKHDFPQFSALFMVVLLAFGGSFLLAQRGEGHLGTNVETSSFWRILYAGVRTLTLAEPVVEYTENDEYKFVTEFLMVVFMFTVIVIMLNILIAQLSDTYQKVQQDAQRGLEVNRAWIVARVELNNFFPRIDYRKKYYEPYENVCNLRRALTKWESPPLNEMNRYIKDIWDSLDTHKMNLLTIQHRLARQENLMRQIGDQLNALAQVQAASRRPDSHGNVNRSSNTDDSNHIERDNVDNVDARENNVDMPGSLVAVSDDIVTSATEETASLDNRNNDINETNL